LALEVDIRGMLVIRLFRIGKKNQPSFKIVITDKRRSSTRGRFVEEVGFYNPLTKEKVLKQDRIKYWLSVGAKPSDTVFNLLISEKIVEGKKVKIYMKKVKKEEKPTAEAPAGEAPGEVKKTPEAKEEKPAPEKPAPEKPAEETAKEPSVKAEESKEKPAEEPPKTQ
jgi:small subunit ribosomal protein S16